MGADFTRRVFITGPNGEIELPGDSPVRMETTVNLVCDGPRCAAHRDAGGPVRLSWVQEKVGDDPINLPDEFAHGIKVEIDPFENKALWFCGPQCSKDYFTYVYIPPKSPREKAAELAHTAGHAIQLPASSYVDAAVGEHDHPTPDEELLP